MRPDFLVIGAARAGTTSLFQYLESHPDIFMSPVKEINFFSNEKYWNKGFGWYEKHFSKATSDIVGEASTSYTRSPFSVDVAQRIYNYNHKMKLIYILRDPIDRFVSHYSHQLDRGLENRAIEDIVDNYKNESLFWQGCYSSQIDQFLQYFPREQLYLFSIHELKEKPEATLRSIYDFLGADANFNAPDLSKHHNANKVVTRKSAFGLALLKYYRQNIEQKDLPYRFKKFFLRAAEFGAEKTDVPALSSELYEKLREAYLPEVQKLATSYGIDTSFWRNFN